MTKTFDSAADMVAVQRPESPVFCLRPHVLRERARAFVEAFPGEVLYAVKCNDDRRVLRALYDGGIRHFDTASLAEVAAINDQFGLMTCHFMHPVKSRNAVAEAYHRYNVRTFALDDLGELAKIEETTGNAGDLLLVVRIEVPRSQAVCDLSGKFGATLEEAAVILKAAAAPGRRLGLTFHVGSQCLAPKAYRRAVEVAGRAAALAGMPIDVLDVGGGFPAAYVGTEPPPLPAYIDAVKAGVRAAGLGASRLFCEPGRALVAEGASLVVKVELRRRDRIYLNEGLYGALADMKFVGIDLPMRLVRPGGAPSARMAPFRLFGPTCDSYDSMPGPYWLPEDVGEGDWIEFGQMGAYSNTMRTGFNGFHADEFVYVRDAAFLPTADMLPKAAPRPKAA
jgi:ornithine decarboxylase